MVLSSLCLSSCLLYSMAHQKEKKNRGIPLSFCFGITKRNPNSKPSRGHTTTQAPSMAGTNTNATIRRLASVSNHLAPVRWAPSNGGSIGFCDCSGSINDSYHRIHGQVPTHEPVWRAVACDDSGKEYTDIIYEKAVGEAIAKVSYQVI